MTDKPRVNSELELRVVIFQETGRWVAQVLERDIASHGKTPYAALAAVQLAIKAHALFDTRYQRVPYSRLKPAPAVYWMAYERGQPLPIPPRPLPQERDEIEPMHPAVIHASIAREEIFT